MSKKKKMNTPPVIRVFLSSTFADMEHERSYFNEVLAPKLGRICSDRGVSFFNVDLRWGITEEDQVGGGSVPTQLLPTWAVAVDPRKVTVDGLEERLRRQSDIPIIGRIVKDRYLLDTRTLWEEDFDYIAQAVKEADQ